MKENLKRQKTAKAELQKMRDKFDLLKDVEDPDDPEGEPTNNAASNAVHTVNVNFNHAVHEFADAARRYFKNVKAEYGRNRCRWWLYCTGRH